MKTISKFKAKPTHELKQAKAKQQRRQFFATAAALIALYAIGTYTLLGFFIPE